MRPYALDSLIVGRPELALVEVTRPPQGPVRVRHRHRVRWADALFMSLMAALSRSPHRTTADVATQLARHLAGVATVALETLLALGFELTLHVVIPASALGVADLDDVGAAADVSVLAFGAATVAWTAHDAATLLVAGQPLGLAIFLIDLDELLVRQAAIELVCDALGRLTGLACHRQWAGVAACISERRELNQARRGITGEHSRCEQHDGARAGVARRSMFRHRDGS